MDALTTQGLILFAAAAAALLAAAAAGGYYEVAPRVAYRTRLRVLRREVAAAAAEFAARPPAPHRHNVHCPTCGRFARHTSTSSRGVWSVCKVHGVRLRPVKTVGEVERPPLVMVRVHRGLLGVPPPTPAFELRPPARVRDWLDGEVRPPVTWPPSLAA